MQQNKAKVNHAEKARIGAIGEEAVIIQLLRHKWDAFNANATLANYKSVDVVGLRYLKEKAKPQVALIQVKSMSEKSDLNFPTGFSLKEATDKQLLNDKIVGPYVFVKIKEEGCDFYIVPRSQIIELIYISNKYYIEQIKKDKKTLTGPACVRLLWIEGNDQWANLKNKQFGNPIVLGSTKNQWENIWND